MKQLSLTVFSLTFFCSNIFPQFQTFVVEQRLDETRIEGGKRSLIKSAKIVTEQDRNGNRLVKTFPIASSGETSSTVAIVKFYEACSLESFILNEFAKTAVSEGKFAKKPLNPLRTFIPSSLQTRIVQGDACTVFPVRSLPEKLQIGEECRSNRFSGFTTERRYSKPTQSNGSILTTLTLLKISDRPPASSDLSIPLSYTRSAQAGGSCQQ